ncbi:hypothetical protein HPHPP4D_1085 [Helicobacter pylori Hp P-4d]|uniref:Uncharacterized protein n=1 Tax=Helicobacter pylori Hp P-4 TaxID=992075 RepID=J0EP31_HELPX|nr:hypothetical protein HPHPP4_1424 [Helicobacter pylori Hp P-4]EJC24027.1 hypothetical protein HPHPP4D_1085 [Helicobacter pylori Hp P-4d]
MFRSPCYNSTLMCGKIFIFNFYFLGKAWEKLKPRFLWIGKIYAPI